MNDHKAAVVAVLMLTLGLVVGMLMGATGTYRWATRTVDDAVATSMARQAATPTPACPEGWVIRNGCVTIEMSTDEWQHVGPILGWVTLTPEPPATPTPAPPWVKGGDELTCYDVFESRDWPDYCLPVSVATDLARLRMLDAKATVDAATWTEPSDAFLTALAFCVDNEAEPLLNCLWQLGQAPHPAR